MKAEFEQPYLCNNAINKYSARGISREITEERHIISKFNGKAKSSCSRSFRVTPFVCLQIPCDKGVIRTPISLERKC